MAGHHIRPDLDATPSVEAARIDCMPHLDAVARSLVVHPAIRLADHRTGLEVVDTSCILPAYLGPVDHTDPAGAALTRYFQHHTPAAEPAVELRKYGRLDVHRRRMGLLDCC